MLDLISTPQGVIDHASEVARSGDPAILEVLATSPYTPPSVLRSIAVSSTGTARELAREHVRLPPDAVASFVDEDRELERQEAVRKAKDKLFWMRRPERGRSNPRRILRILHETGEPEVREDIAGDPHTPDSILEMLSTDDAWWVRREVACNRSSSPKLLAKMARDPSDHVRCAVARNPDASAKTLGALQKDGSQRVRSAARDVLMARAGKPLFDVSSTVDHTGDSAPSSLDSPAGERFEEPSAAASVLQAEDTIPNSFTIEALVAGEVRATTFDDTRNATDVLAVQTVVLFERSRGHVPIVMPHNNEGYDVASRARDGAPLLIEVKGASPTARSVQMTRSQLDLAAAHRDRFVLAIVLHDGEAPWELLWWPNPYPDPPPAIVAAVELDLLEVRRRATSVNLDVPVSARKSLNPLFTIGDTTATTTE
jgi:hypothetical protein